MNVTGIYLSRKLRMLRYSSKPPRYGLRLARFAADVNLGILAIAMVQFVMALLRAGRLVGLVTVIIALVAMALITVVLLISTRKAVRLWWRETIVAKLPAICQRASMIGESALVAQRQTPAGPARRNAENRLSHEGIEMLRKEATDGKGPLAANIVARLASSSGISKWTETEASEVETSGIANVPFSSIMVDFPPYEPKYQQWGYSTVEWPSVDSAGFILGSEGALSLSVDAERVGVNADLERLATQRAVLQRARASSISPARSESALQRARASTISPTRSESALVRVGSTFATDGL